MSLLSRFDRISALGKHRFADLTNRSVASSRGTIFPPVKDNLKMELTPGIPWEKGFQVLFGLFNARAIGQFPPLGEAMNVGINCECRMPEGLGHHHRGRFVPHPGKGLEILEIGRHFPSMFFD